MSKPFKAEALRNTYEEINQYSESLEQQLDSHLEQLIALEEKLKTRFKKLLISQVSLLRYRERHPEYWNGCRSFNHDNVARGKHDNITQIDTHTDSLLVDAGGKRSVVINDYTDATVNTMSSTVSSEKSLDGQYTQLMSYRDEHKNGQSDKNADISGQETKGTDRKFVVTDHTRQSFKPCFANQERRGSHLNYQRSPESNNVTSTDSAKSPHSKTYQAPDSPKEHGITCERKATNLKSQSHPNPRDDTVSQRLHKLVNKMQRFRESVPPTFRRTEKSSPGTGCSDIADYETNEKNRQNMSQCFCRTQSPQCVSRDVRSTKQDLVNTAGHTVNIKQDINSYCGAPCGQFIRTQNYEERHHIGDRDQTDIDQMDLHPATMRNEELVLKSGRYVSHDPSSGQDKGASCHRQHDGEVQYSNRTDQRDSRKDLSQQFRIITALHAMDGRPIESAKIRTRMRVHSTSGVNNDNATPCINAPWFQESENIMRGFTMQQLSSKLNRSKLEADEYTIDADVNQNTCNSACNDYPSYDKPIIKSGGCYGMRENPKHPLYTRYSYQARTQRPAETNYYVTRGQQIDGHYKTFVDLNKKESRNKKVRYCSYSEDPLMHEIIDESSGRDGGIYPSCQHLSDTCRSFRHYDEERLGKGWTNDSKVTYDDLTEDNNYRQAHFGTEVNGHGRWVQLLEGSHDRCQSVDMVVTEDTKIREMLCYSSLCGLVRLIQEAVDDSENGDHDPLVWEAIGANISRLAGCIERLNSELQTDSNLLLEDAVEEAMRHVTHAVDLVLKDKVSAPRHDRIRRELEMAIGDVETAAFDLGSHSRGKLLRRETQHLMSELQGLAQCFEMYGNRFAQNLETSSKSLISTRDYKTGQHEPRTGPSFVNPLTDQSSCLHSNRAGFEYKPHRKEKQLHHSNQQPLYPGKENSRYFCTDRPLCPSYKESGYHSNQQPLYQGNENQRYSNYNPICPSDNEARCPCIGKHLYSSNEARSADVPAHAIGGTANATIETSPCYCRCENTEKHRGGLQNSVDIEPGTSFYRSYGRDGRTFADDHGKMLPSDTRQSAHKTPKQTTICQKPDSVAMVMHPCQTEEILKPKMSPGPPFRQKLTSKSFSGSSFISGSMLRILFLFGALLGGALVLLGPRLAGFGRSLLIEIIHILVCNIQLTHIYPSVQ